MEPFFEEKWDLERNKERRRTPNVENREQGIFGNEESFSRRRKKRVLKRHFKETLYKCGGGFRTTCLILNGRETVVF